MTNARVRSLTVLSQDGRVNGQIVWSCQCDCGRLVKVRGSVLRSGRISSCGCMKSERRRTHGMTGSPEYRAWSNMRVRCYNESHKDYGLYGGRGVKVHADWLGRGSFEAFLAHVGPRPSPLHSLDRIDPNKDYEPGNVRWAVAKIQARNTRVKRTNKTGVAGVRASGSNFLVSIQLTETDFFEACCVRKSLENRLWAEPRN